MDISNKKATYDRPESIVLPIALANNILSGEGGDNGGMQNGGFLDE